MSPVPSRRAVLSATAVAAVSGCLSGQRASEERCEGLSEPVSPENEPGEGFPAIELEPDESEEAHVAIAVDLLRQFDENAPARVRLTVANDSDDEWTFVFHALKPFPPVAGTHVATDSRLVLEPVDQHDPSVDRPDEPENGCWRVRDGTDVVDVQDSATLKPCENVTREYDVYDANDEGCLEEGEYRFETHDMGEQGHEWGFSLFLTGS